MGDGELTPQEMDQEAEVVAERLADMVEAGATPGRSALEIAAAMGPHGLKLFGEVGEGVDDGANRARFAAKVAGKLGDKLADRLMPLQEGQAA